MFNKIIINNTTRQILQNFIKKCVHTECTKVGILGVPFEQGQRKPGVANGPKAIRDHGLIKMLNTIEDLEVTDYGDVTYKPEKGINMENMKSLDHVAACTKRVSDEVRSILSTGKRVITIGGDHSVAVGTMDGHIRAKGSNIALIWVDAHGDLNTNCTSDSGNVHGMPVALLTKELSDYWPYLPGMDWQKPELSIRNVAYIGLRSVDKYERLIIDKFGITAFGMEDIERLGITAVIQMILSRIDPFNDKSLHISFDIDSLDALEAPSTGTAVRGGLTLREALTIVETFYRTGKVWAFDLVEVNPQIGDNKDVKITLDAAISILMASCGHVRQGRYPKNVDLPKPE